MKILGLNIYHGDASACLIENNKILIAVEEERINRIKHSAGFPINSIKYCLEYTNTDLSEIEYVCINRDTKKNFLRKLLFLLTNKLNLRYLSDRIQKAKKILNVEKTFKENFDKNKINFKVVNVEHHISHLSSAYHLSGFKESALLSVDGFGDFVSTMWGSANKNKINIIDKIYFPHSLGIFYSAITQHLGFPNYGDEYKLMGLSSYGKNNYENKIDKLFKNTSHKFKLDIKYFNHTSNKFHFDFSNNIPKIGHLFSKEVTEILGYKRLQNEEITQYHKDIAKSAQCVYENIFFEICNKLYSYNISENLSLSGGCAQNSVANGKIFDRTKFKNVYISSASGDAGGALGSVTSFLSKKNIFFEKQKNSFHGPKFDNTQILNSIKNVKSQLEAKKIKKIEFNSKDEKYIFTAKEIENRKIVGWFQGCMEWGPRSLGNRSILASPSVQNIKDIINEKIKRRESFRPFAPSIMAEHISSWFENNHESIFMSFVSKVRENKKSIIPSVVHVDGTARLQTVTRENNENFYNLINEFYKLTNIPMILNTSFNENEPIVMTPDEAIKCFLRTNMDLIVLEDVALIRS